MASGCFDLQEAIDKVSVWFQGCTLPSLVPRETLQKLEMEREEMDEDNKEEETDAEVAKRDLIQV